MALRISYFVTPSKLLAFSGDATHSGFRKLCYPYMPNLRDNYVCKNTSIVNVFSHKIVHGLNQI